MNIGEQIKYMLKVRDKTQRWLANEMGLDEKTLSGKFSRASVSAEELLTIGNLLDIDLNKMKKGDITMFNWLQESKGYYKDEQISFLRVDISNKKVVCGFYNDETNKEEEIELHIGESGLYYHFTMFENWEEELYKNLLKDGSLLFRTMSTESGDDWTVEVFRTEYTITPEYGFGSITMVNYIAVSIGEIQYNIGEIQDNMLTIEKTKDNQNVFAEWMNNFSKSTSLLNDRNGDCECYTAITFEDSQISDEEYKILCDLFNAE